VVLGIEDSWDLTTATPARQSFYLSSTWSPCSQFVAVVTQEAIEIQDALSLKLLSSFNSTKVGAKFRQGLAYSPDGHSLACCSDASIIIWDTQTGGMGTNIECDVTGSGLELIWSLNGRKICTISSKILQAFTISVYDAASTTKLRSMTIQSESEPHCWAYNESFRIVSTAQGHKGWTISIFEIGHTLTRIESFPFQFKYPFQAFSPTTYRVLVTTTQDHHRDYKLIVLAIQDSNILLETAGSYWYPTFSPDASLLAAFTEGHLLVWRCTSGHYTQWREFQQTAMPLQFSPNLSSIMGCDSALLHILHLDYISGTLPKNPVPAGTSGKPKDAYSPGTTYIATTRSGESVVTITSLYSQTHSPSRLIKTEFKISEIVLTGNVLLVKGPDSVVAWLLTEEGIVDGVFGNRTADHSDSVWTISPQQERDPGFLSRLLRQDRGGNNGDEHLEFSNSDGIAAIRRRNGLQAHIYNAETGEIVEPGKAPLNRKRTWYRFHNAHRDDCDLYHHDLFKHHTSPESNWPVSQSTLRDGWVKDTEGRHRMWLHPRWRSVGNDVTWLDRVTTLRLKNSSELVVIKF
jgi:hypothetical protein